MIRKLADGRFRLYSRKKIRAPESAETSGRSLQDGRRCSTSVRFSFSNGAERKGRHSTALAVVRDAEFLFAAVEDQRHYQVLLIVEMPDEPFEQTALASA